MGCEAGLKPGEIEEMPPCDVWMVIEGYEKRKRFDWEQTRVTLYIIAKYSGNMKNPNISIQKFFPLSWDRETNQKGDSIVEHHQAMIARRKKLELMMQEQSK